MSDAPTTAPGGILFDPQDHELLRIVNDVLARGHGSSWKRLLAPYLHPHGIKELSASKGLRIAYAVIHLLGSLERGKAEDRLAALRGLRDEVLSAPESALRINTARVLVQIMKELVRAKGHSRRQLELAHDFRRAVTGKPLVIRAELAKHHLLEMPEEWNQMCFDDHVHDANTKGRKSPTHLVMDAWIKGIRKLTVVTYNHIQPDAAQELLEAAVIMNISARVGVEFRARHQGRFAKLLWTPRGFTDCDEFLDFLRKPAMREFCEQGRQVSLYQQRYVWSVLDKYNRELRLRIGREYGVDLPELTHEGFAAHVGAGQPSTYHLGHFIGQRIDKARGESARERADAVGLPEEVDAESIVDRWLQPSANPDIENTFAPIENAEAPELLSLTARELCERIASLHVNNWITLDLSGLTVQDVLFLLYDCRGAITHLEIFNLRTHERGAQADLAAILELQEIINSANPVRFKKFVRRAMDELEQEDTPRSREAHARMADILDQISIFLAFYRRRTLRVRIGTDSTGQSGRRHGMGLVVTETLPTRARRALGRRGHQLRKPLPLFLEVTPQTVCTPRRANGAAGAFLRLLRGVFPGCGPGHEARRSWIKGGCSLAPDGKGNVFTLGGVRAHPPASQLEAAPARKGPGFSWTYMNSHLKNGLKVLLGFIPAALTFALTKDWWVLAWLGPFIWFGITGLRNIIQSVLGGGGLWRSPLLRWNNYVSWDRLADSLLFTGFSVPLLDYLVKTLLLERGFGVTTATDPFTLYAVMGLINGLYLSGHNLLRGLPRAAVYGNFFRSVLSIPLAVLFNAVAGNILGAYGVAAVNDVLQKWAAIISKLASDCVAGVIEGLADRAANMALRRRDLREKFRQVYETYALLEVLYPQEDMLELLESPETIIETLSYEHRDLDKIVIVNALDFMHFWMYQPRARTVMRQMLAAMSQDERKAFLLSQYVLRREKEISLLLVNGLLGRQFSRALAFYLNNAQTYLDDIQALASKP
ncbi:hypothetical protein dsat_2848 [Alkalidesulfovibrio alkalitolerans DSM 16529]|uniref:Uncharacterized protein n=1 Tax=Alkalidesulfovibrio alkalitolerans DSM 16529 TaxID=1121439 RepID=S7TCP5_9BACT|nr:hypothetical protein [Alkalidesulfovibrio alkalitolerans]EPR34290.1 hypothetical protein dsat_2848 [Alkalidesulfovibrio alkalitolerans DSM 16529]